MTKWFDPIATGAAHFIGHPSALFIAAFATCVGMFTVGIDATNIAVSVVSLMLLCLLQYTQNRDGLAVQAKLDELIRATTEARNELIGIDKKTAVEIEDTRCE